MSASMLALTVLLVVMALGLAVGLPACMLSSMLSREEEQLARCVEKAAEEGE